MTDQLIHPDDEFAAIQAASPLFDALAAGTPVDADDPTAALLLAWRDELDDGLVTSAPAVPLQRRTAGTTWTFRQRRHTAAALAAAVVLAASTGVAAAAVQVGPFAS